MCENPTAIRQTIDRETVAKGGGGVRYIRLPKLWQALMETYNILHSKPHLAITIEVIAMRCFASENGKMYLQLLRNFIKVSLFFPSKNQQEIKFSIFGLRNYYIPNM